MRIDDLDHDTMFLFMTMMQAALKLRDMGRSKKEFVLFADEIWNSMELNDENELRRILAEKMLSDLQQNS
jgi:hypothetical protein